MLSLTTGAAVGALWFIPGMFGSIAGGLADLGDNDMPFDIKKIGNVNATEIKTAWKNSFISGNYTPLPECYFKFIHSYKKSSSIALPAFWGWNSISATPDGGRSISYFMDGIISTDGPWDHDQVSWTIHTFFIKVVVRLCIKGVGSIRGVPLTFLEFMRMLLKHHVIQANLWVRWAFGSNHPHWGAL